MKQRLYLIVIVILMGCQYSVKNTQSESTVEKKKIELPSVKARFVKNISELNQFKNDTTTLDTIDNIDHLSFPKIKGIRMFEAMDGRFICNKTFTPNFNTILVSINEEGDYGSSVILYNYKEDSIISSKELFQIGMYENDYKHKYSTVFLNDSTFTIQLEAQGMAMDSTNYIIDSLDFRIKKQVFEIATNGGFRLLEEDEKKWREGKNN